MFEVAWGLIPDMTGTQLLPELVGRDVAKELTYTARVVSGEEAVRIGLATRTDRNPVAAALAMAAEIAGRSPTARVQRPRDGFPHGVRNWRQPPGRVVWPTSIRCPSGSRM